MGSSAVVHALCVARAVPTYYGGELVPVWVSVGIPLLLLVPSDCLVWAGEPKEVDLRNRHVDELLAELVVGEALDAPQSGRRSLSEWVPTGGARNDA